MNCKNCGEILSGNFCSHCGQSSNVSQITLSKLLNDLTESVFQFNSGFLYTVKILFTRPGKSIQDFLDGKRKKYFKPVAYALLFSTVYFLVSKFTNQETLLGSAISGFSEGYNSSDDEFGMRKMSAFIAENYAYATLLLIPVFSFASYTCFSRSKINYLEHVILNCYITGQQAILYTLFTLILSVLDFDLLEIFSVLTAVTYSLWVFLQFFSERGVGSIIFRVILTYLLYFILSAFVFLLSLGFKDFI